MLKDKISDWSEKLKENFNLLLEYFDWEQESEQAYEVANTINFAREEATNLTKETVNEWYPDEMVEMP